MRWQSIIRKESLMALLWWHFYDDEQQQQQQQQNIPQVRRMAASSEFPLGSCFGPCPKLWSCRLLGYLSLGQRLGLE